MDPSPGSNPSTLPPRERRRAILLTPTFTETTAHHPNCCEKKMDPSRGSNPSTLPPRERRRALLLTPPFTETTAHHPNCCGTAVVLC